MSLAPYGSEQRELTDSALRRAFMRVAGTYDLGARVRYAAVERELSGLPVPRRVLDAGSGRGELCFALARRWPSAEIVGVDYDAPLVDHANQLRAIAFESSRIEFISARLPLAFATRFDVVLSIDVLEHVDDDRGFLRSLYDATGDGGRLILHTPALAQRRFLAEFPEQHDHVRDGYDPAELSALLSEAGYREVRLRATFGPLGSLAWEGFALAKRGNRLAAATLPLWYALSALDTVTDPKRGLGILATARR
jgi:SAM-dependent methyltransferase